MPKTLFRTIITITLTLGLSISAQSLLAAWVAPTADPPTQSVSYPLHTGNSIQTKQGSLEVNQAGLATDNALVSLNGHIIAANGNIQASGHMVADSGNSYIGGQLGIGVYPPNAELDVVGDIGLSGNLVCTDCVDATDIVANAVGTSEVANNSLTADDLAAGSVGTSEVLNNSLTADDLADVVEGAQSRCANTRYLRGDGVCRTAAQVVSDGGAGVDCFGIGRKCVADGTQISTNYSNVCMGYARRNGNSLQVRASLWVGTYDTGWVNAYDVTTSNGVCTTALNARGITVTRNGSGSNTQDW